MLSVLYRYVRVLSLDVVAGALVGAWFFAAHFGVALPWPVLTSLALAIWLIYTLDHLADARKITHTPHTFRHRFHQQHQCWLWLAVLVAAVLGIVLLWLLPAPTLRLGATVASVAILYFVGNILVKRSFAFVKELSGALIYSAGVFTGPLSLLPAPWPAEAYLYIGQLTMVALANLLIFALFELHIDTADGHNSLIRRLGTPVSKQVILIVLLVIFASIALGFIITPAHSHVVQWLFLLMAVALTFIFIFEAFFVHNERYRVLGDAIFFFPALYLLLV